MNGQINDIDDLIGKELAGEAKAEEKIRLKNWVSLSESNRQYAEQLKAIFESAFSNAVHVEVDTDAAWSRVQAAIKEKTPGKDLQGTSGWKPLRIAAGIAILVSASILVYRWMQQPAQIFAMQSDTETRQDTLPDGSTAFLNKKSSIVFEYSPRQKTRKVKLNGEGFFDVRHEEEKPFIIEAQDVLVRDLGTAFNVKAYPNRDTIEVQVKTGEVQVYTLQNPGMLLTAGQTGQYSKKSQQFWRLETRDSNALAYKTRVFSFNNTDLQTVIDKINDVYSSKIKLENPGLATCRLTVNFNHDTLDIVVEVIAETLKLSVTRRDKEIMLNGPGCQ